jgi:hypothetical protein
MTRVPQKTTQPAAVQQAPRDPSNPYLSTPQAPRNQLGPSPTFLPDPEEGVMTRTGKNIAQGWLASTGWHIFDMAQQVDFFPHHKIPQKPDDTDE